MMHLLADRMADRVAAPDRRCGAPERQRRRPELIRARLLRPTQPPYALPSLCAGDLDGSQWHDVAVGFRLDDGAKQARPSVESLAQFGLVLVLIVNSLESTAGMSERKLGDVSAIRNAESLLLKVRRKSCKRHGESASPVSAIAASSRALPLA